MAARRRTRAPRRRRDVRVEINGSQWITGLNGGTRRGGRRGRVARCRETRARRVTHGPPRFRVPGRGSTR